jgi:hypothetical protein
MAQSVIKSKRGLVCIAPPWLLTLLSRTPTQVQAIMDMCMKNPAVIQQMLSSGALDAFPPVLAVLRNMRQQAAHGEGSTR